MARAGQRQGKVGGKVREETGGGADLEGHAATGRTPVLTLREMESL